MPNYISTYMCVLKSERLEAIKRMGMLSWTQLPCICLVVPRRPDYINLLLMSGPDQRWRRTSFISKIQKTTSL